MIVEFDVFSNTVVFLFVPQLSAVYSIEIGIGKQKLQVRLLNHFQFFQRRV